MAQKSRPLQHENDIEFYMFQTDTWKNGYFQWWDGEKHDEDVQPPGPLTGAATMFLNMFNALWSFFISWIWWKMIPEDCSCTWLEWRTSCPSCNKWCIQRHMVVCLVSRKPPAADVYWPPMRVGRKRPCQAASNEEKSLLQTVHNSALFILFRHTLSCFEDV